MCSRVKSIAALSIKANLTVCSFQILTLIKSITYFGMSDER